MYKRGDTVLLDRRDHLGGIYTVLRTYRNSKNILNVFLALGYLNIEQCAAHPDWDYVYCAGDVETLTVR